MRFAYADPPYPGQAAKHYGDHPDFAGEVDHRELVDGLVAEYPDGWVLSTGAKWLRKVLLLCPDDVRVLAWVKPGSSPPFTVRPQYSWEPVILAGGRRYEKGDPRNVWDSLVHPAHTLQITWTNGRLGTHVIGEKPPAFCRWVFQCLGARGTDEIVDLFPGSGAVGREWERWRSQMGLFDQLPDFVPSPNQQRGG